MFALKNAIQVRYQLEDSELAVEALPGAEMPEALLFYEASEGGAGVLRRLVEDPNAFAQICRDALEICHFNPETGEDLRRAPRASEDCEAACYDCLLSYSNQREHPILDRKLLPPILLEWSRSHLTQEPISETRQQCTERLLKMCDSDLEKRWIHYLNAQEARLPDDSQSYLKEGNTKPDFLYRAQKAAIYIDGPHHDSASKKALDQDQQYALEDAGWQVLRFPYSAAGLAAEESEWLKKLQDNPHLFGKIAVVEAPATAPTKDDLDLFAQCWHPLIDHARSLGLSVREGWDLHSGKEVVGAVELQIENTALARAVSPEMEAAAKATGLTLVQADPGDYKVIDIILKPVHL